MDDTQCLAQIKSGDGNALETLIKSYYQSVFAYCYRHTANKDLAQDLTQDTFLKMIKSIDKYTHYGTFQNYLYVIAGNVCKDYFKKSKLIYMDNLPEQEANFIAAEDILAVRDAIAALPFCERNVIVLRYYQDCTVPEIAKITNTTLALAKYRLRTATAKLRTRLEDFND
ncbi:MAG: sigma-70 family RNA polymerase sigma factor [Ruthenibacterium sp.]